MNLLNMKYIILSLLPILIYILYTIPGWFFGITYSSSIFAFVTACVIFTLTPIYLVVISYFQIPENNIILSFVILFLFMLFIYSLFLLVTYVFGGLSTNIDLLHPNEMTKGLTILGIKFGMFILTVSWALACTIKWCRS